MTKDLRFGPGPDEAVDNHFWIASTTAGEADTVAQSGLAFLACCLFAMFCRRGPWLAAGRQRRPFTE